MIRIIFLALIIFMVFKVASMAWQSIRAQKQTPPAPKGPRSVNGWPAADDADASLVRDQASVDHGYWQKKVQDAYRQGYKDGLDDGKNQGDGMH